MMQSPLKLLWLMQLSSTTLPIGATAHSYGLETLTAEGTLSVSQLEAFLHDYAAEVGVQESYFCRLGPKAPRHQVWKSEFSFTVFQLRWFRERAILCNKI